MALGLAPTHGAVLDVRLGPGSDFGVGGGGGTRLMHDSGRVKLHCLIETGRSVRDSTGVARPGRSQPGSE